MNSVTFQSLPKDIFNQIISFTDKKTRLELSLVCKQFNNPIFWKHVFVNQISPESRDVTAPLNWKIVIYLNERLLETPEQSSAEYKKIITNSKKIGNFIFLSAKDSDTIFKVSLNPLSKTVFDVRNQASAHLFDVDSKGQKIYIGDKEHGKIFISESKKAKFEEFFKSSFKTKSLHIVGNDLIIFHKKPKNNLSFFKLNAEKPDARLSTIKFKLARILDTKIVLLGEKQLEVIDILSRKSLFIKENSELSLVDKKKVHFFNDSFAVRGKEEKGHELTFYSMKEGAKQHTKTFEKQPCGISVLPKELFDTSKEVICIGFSGGRIEIYDPLDNKTLYSIDTGIDGSITKIVSHGYRLYFLCYKNNEVFAWDLTTNRLIKDFDQKPAPFKQKQKVDIKIMGGSLFKTMTYDGSKSVGTKLTEIKLEK